MRYCVKLSESALSPIRSALARAAQYPLSTDAALRTELCGVVLFLTARTARYTRIKYKYIIYKYKA